MFLDPFTFDPPNPEVLTRAVESYQRVACKRFFNYMRKAQNRGLLPLNVTGETLDPTPRQLYLEVRSMRHLTAIQKTFRDFGGPLFNPNSPIPPGKRFQLVERRLEAIEETLGDADAGFVDDAALGAEPARHSVGEGGSPSSASSGPSGSRAEALGEGGVSHSVNPVSSPSSFYYPPEIEDLLNAVDYAQHVFVARAELLDKRQLDLSPEDFAWEILAMRDLTAIIRTLRRMSAHKLPEDEPLSKADAESEASSLGTPSTSSASSSSNPVSSSPSPGMEPARHSPGEGGSSNLVNPVNPVRSPSSVPKVPEVRAVKPGRDTNPAAEPEHPRSPVPGRASSHDPSSQISNLKSGIPNPSAAESSAPPPGNSSHPSHRSHDFPQPSDPDDEPGFPENPHASHRSHSPQGSYGAPVLHDKDPP